MTRQRGARRARRAPTSHLLLCQSKHCAEVATKLVSTKSTGAAMIWLRCTDCAEAQVKFYEEYLPNYTIVVKQIT